MKTKSIIKTSLLALVVGAVVTLPRMSYSADDKAADMQSIKGEVVDLMCYLDHGAKGEKHKGCAEKCIKGGGPVGLLSGDQLYLVVGDHEPMNEQLAPKAAQTVTLKGKVVERHGMKMIEKATLVQ